MKMDNDKHSNQGQSQKLSSVSEEQLSPRKDNSSMSDSLQNSSKAQPVFEVTSVAAENGSSQASSKRV